MFLNTKKPESLINSAIRYFSLLPAAIIEYASDGICDLYVIRLTYQGHQLLETIRPQSTWDKIYAISEKTGHKSITTVMEIADIVLPDAIKSALHS